MEAFCRLLTSINESIVNPAIILLFSLALFFFLWGVVEYISNAESDEGRQKGQQHILWGIIGMVIMVSVFGILNIVLNTFGIDTPSTCGNWGF